MLSKFKQSKRLTQIQQEYYDKIRQVLIDNGMAYVRANIIPENVEIYNLAINDYFNLIMTYSYNNRSELKNQEIII